MSFVSTYSPPLTQVIDDFRLGNYGVSGDYAAGSILDPGYRIRTLDDYGFVAGSTILCDVTYYIKGGASATAKARLTKLNNDDTYTTVASSEGTTTNTTTIQAITVTGLSLTIGEQYHTQIGSSSAITQIKFYGTKIKIRTT